MGAGLAGSVSSVPGLEVSVQEEVRKSKEALGLGHSALWCQTLSSAPGAASGWVTRRNEFFPLYVFMSPPEVTC